ncbi:MAG: hypothetical protein ACRCYR_01960 [Phycicoccus sp.]
MLSTSVDPEFCRTYRELAIGHPDDPALGNPWAVVPGCSPPFVRRETQHMPRSVENVRSSSDRRAVRAAAGVAVTLAVGVSLAAAGPVAAAPDPGATPSASPTPTASPTNATSERWGFADEQWTAIDAGTVDTKQTEANRAAAEKIYGAPGSLSSATDPVPADVARASARVDPWLQYISASNAPLTVHEFVVRVRNADGGLVLKRYGGAEIAKLISTGVGGAAYDFRDNSTQSLTAVTNKDGSATLSKEEVERFTHLYFGGQDGGVEGMAMAVLASGDGYMECGIDFKNANFDQFPGQNGNDGSYHTPINGSYQTVTSTPRWFGISNANE